MAGRRGAVVRTSRERLTRSEPFEVFTRPQRSLLARILGLLIRLRAELLVAALAVAAWVWLTDRMPTWVAGLVVGALVLAAGLFPPSRRYLLRRAYAVMTRHRLRAVCVERRIMNYSGNVPVQLWARPTAVGERVWLLLRAGIDAGDIQNNLSHVASACWGSDARVNAHRSMSALVVLDVIRRDPFTGAPVSSPHREPIADRRLNLVPPTHVGGEHSA